MKWWRRKQLEEDLDRELRSDFELETAELEERGLSPEEAQYAAKRALGNAGSIKEEVREAWGWASLDRLRQDVFYALRTFGRAPGFTAVVILTLALGISATTAVFSIVHAVLLNPLPFPNQDRLVAVFEKLVSIPDDPPFFVSYHDFENWKSGSQSFERLTVATWNTGGGQILTGAGPTRDTLAMPVGVDFFPMLGIAPELGRVFAPDDVNTGCRVVLKHAFWTQTFGSEKTAVGRHIQINNDACTVIGVMPPEFTFYPDAIEMWMLITPNSPFVRNPNLAVVGVFGLLKPGVSIAHAEEELATLYKNSPNPTMGIPITPAVYPLAEQFARLTGPTLRFSIVVLFGAVNLVLFIGCLNIANLLLGRSVTRQKEIAVRAALGSSRARIIRQLLTEALLLSVIGGGLGILLAITGVHYFRGLNPIAMPPGNPVTVNLSVLVFTVSLVFVTAVLFGLIPAMKASRVNLMDALRASAQAASLGRAARMLRRALVIIEVALSLALIVGAGLLIQSVHHLASVPLGFRTDHVSTMQIILPRWIYSTPEQRATFFRAALGRTAGSDVVSTGLTSLVPPDGTGGDAVAVEGKPEPSSEAAILNNVLPISVTGSYFKVMAVPLELGRVFDDRDSEKSAPVTVVNQTFARKYFSGENPIGARFQMERPGANGRPWLTIVGVVGDEKHQNFFRPMSWEEPAIIYRPVSQEPPTRAYLLFRTMSDRAAIVAMLQKQIEALDKNVAIGNIEPIDERLSRTLSYPKVRAIVLAAFAALAVLLAAIGLFAVLSQAIAQRTPEFGVRMALGAQKTDLVKLVLWEGITLTLAGLAAGLVISVSVAGLFRSLVYGLTTTDPWTLAVGSLLLLFVALSAMCIPAMRAARVDPKIALRYE
jgi:predicted permease